MLRGDIAEGRAHFDQAIALYAPAAHRPLATRFGEDQRVVSLFFRSRALWVLGYSESALVDTDHALEDARESPVSAFLALAGAFYINCFCGNYTIANAQVDELVALADEKNSKPLTCPHGWGSYCRSPHCAGVDRTSPQ
jgi:hypothetical protein